MLKGLDHIQLCMPAQAEDKARGFYADILGLKEVAKPESLRGRGGCWFVLVDMGIHLGVEQDFRAARKAHPAFHVNDLDTLANVLVQEGYAVQWDDVVPNVRRFYTSDPFGNRLEFLADNY